MNILAGRRGCLGKLFRGLPVGGYMAIACRDGVDARLVEQRLASDPGWFFGACSHPRQPGAIASLTGVLVLLPWLAGFFLVLGLAATTLAAMRRATSRGRDVQILRAVGFTPGDIRRSLLSEAAMIGCVGLLLGIPLGLSLGRGAWNLATGDLGVAATQGSPLVVILGTLVVAAVGTVFVTVVGAPRTIAAAGRSVRRDPQ